MIGLILHLEHKAKKLFKYLYIFPKLLNEHIGVRKSFSSLMKTLYFVI